MTTVRSALTICEGLLRVEDGGRDWGVLIEESSKLSAREDACLMPSSQTSGLTRSLSAGATMRR